MPGGRRKKHGGSGGGSEDIQYPPGCKEVKENMPRDQLFRRLEALASAFQDMSQDDDKNNDYISLSIHLASEGFLQHTSQGIKLLVACCIADILRIYAPSAPYSDEEHITSIFEFLIEQLEGLKDPSKPSFKRYFYLLENLSSVKSFNMCFELENANEIICKAFELIFRIINEKQSLSARNYMVDFLSPMITECDTVSNELLNIILKHILLEGEPLEGVKKCCYNLASDLITRCSEALQSPILNLFNQVLIYNRTDENLFICQKIYDLIYELYRICPSIVLPIFPSFESKLTSIEEKDRIASVTLLAKLFQQKHSNLSDQFEQLWQAFLARFNDISMDIRVKCVQYTKHFFVNHPGRRADIIEVLKVRSRDTHEAVRLEVIKSVVATINADVTLVSENEELLSCIKERTMDTKFNIRKEALLCLALVYKKNLENSYPSEGCAALAWIKNKLLLSYFSAENRLLVQRILQQHLVPYKLGVKDRMIRLLFLYATLDDDMTKVFNEILKSLVGARQSVSALLECIKSPDATDASQQVHNERVGRRMLAVAKYLSEPVKGLEMIRKLCEHMKKDTVLMKSIETIVNPLTDCETCVEAGKTVIGKLGKPSIKNSYHPAIMTLLERISNLLIDREGVKQILSMLVKIADNEGRTLEKLGLPRDVVIGRGLSLISALTFLFPSFFDGEIIDLLILMMGVSTTTKDLDVIPVILNSLTNIGKCNGAIGAQYPNLISVIIPQCQKVILSGTPRQAKAAIRCLSVNLEEENQKLGFDKTLLSTLQRNLDTGPTNPKFRTAIVSLGHIAQLKPGIKIGDEDVKRLICSRVVKKLLINSHQEDEDDRSDNRTNCNGEWCEDIFLPELTQCMKEGMKAVVRWLIGSSASNSKVALDYPPRAFKMFTAFISTGGDLGKEREDRSEHDEIQFSDAEKSWLRLTAGCSILKICEHNSSIGSQFTPAQFLILSTLMVDPVTEVRSRFMARLHKGLSRGIPNKCLPLDFMGLFALAGLEQNKKQRMITKKYIISAIDKRQFYAQSLLAAQKGLDNSSTTPARHPQQDLLAMKLPAFVIVYVVVVLMHSQRFTNCEDLTQLLEIRNCLWFILEPLIVKNENFCYGFYKTLLDKMKQCKNAIEPENEVLNKKMYTICDLSYQLILNYATPNYDLKDFPSNPKLPANYFVKHENPKWVNTGSYLPIGFKFPPPPKRAGELLLIPQVGAKRPKKSEVKKAVKAPRTKKGKNTPKRKGSSASVDTTSEEEDEKEESSRDLNASSKSSTIDSGSSHRSLRPRRPPVAEVEPPQESNHPSGSEEDEEAEDDDD